MLGDTSASPGSCMPRALQAAGGGVAAAAPWFPPGSSQRSRCAVFSCFRQRCRRCKRRSESAAHRRGCDGRRVHSTAVGARRQLLRVAESCMDLCVLGKSGFECASPRAGRREELTGAGA